MPEPLALDLTYDAFSALNAGDDTLAYRDLFARHEDLPRALRRWVEARGMAARGLALRDRQVGGMSEKGADLIQPDICVVGGFLFGLRDGYAIETVLIRRRDGFTACVSSQVGCAFACRFCASGQAGLKRNLTPGEIVEQVVRLGPKVNRIVFMGIGEPLNNYDNVLSAIRILRDRRGMAFPTTGITISTIGIPKGLKALREEHLALNLTISLHATTDEQRGALIPGARKHPIAEVVSGALSWARRHNRTATFVYLLLPGINDDRADLARLVDMFRGAPARINLMRWNAVDGLDFRRIGDHRLMQFRRALERAGIPTVVRDTQGNRIDAACGQLWLRDLQGLPLAKAA